MPETVAPQARALPALFRRLLWHINRTNLAWILKWVLSLLNARDKAARRGAARRLEVGPAISAKAADLKRDGYAVITDFVDPFLVNAVASASAEKLMRAESLVGRQTVTHKSFWVRLLDEDKHNGAFRSDNVFVRFATQPAVTRLLSAYLGELPRLVDVLLTLSKDTDHALSYSQLWHKDYDDVKTLKVFIYLTDVEDVADGPFTFLPGPASDRVGFIVKSHVADERMFRRIDRARVVEMRGARLTAFVCETSRCFHMGSRLAPGHSRLMYTATFISAPRLYPEPPPLFAANGPLDETQRLLLKA